MSKVTVTIAYDGAFFTYSDCLVMFFSQNAKRANRFLKRRLVFGRASSAREMNHIHVVLLYYSEFAEDHFNNVM